jgi:hypothetical protein
MDPQHISAEVRMQPEFQWKAGDRRTTPQGALLNGYREDSYWVSELHPIHKESISETLEHYLLTLGDAKAFMADFCLTGGSIEFLIGWFVGANSGEVFHCSLLGRLVELQISLAFDVYGDRTQAESVSS